MHHVGAPVAASTARAAHPATPLCCRYGGRMSCVVGQKLGRIHDPISPDTSARYSSISPFDTRHVKYVYDWWNPTSASPRIIAGRVNASDRKMTSGCDAAMSARI